MRDLSRGAQRGSPSTRSPRPIPRHGDRAQDRSFGVDDRATIVRMTDRLDHDRSSSTAGSLVAASSQRRIVSTIAAVLVGLSMLTSCSGNSTPMIRGTPISSFACPPRSAGGQLDHIGVADVTAVVLCPLSANGAAVTLGPSDPTFRPLLQALASPDRARTHGACLTYADIPQTVEVKEATAFDLVHIPVDQCGHYQKTALTELTKARSG